MCCLGSCHPPSGHLPSQVHTLLAFDGSCRGALIRISEGSNFAAREEGLISQKAK